jgi:acetyl-CoA carboxylase biotin carboxylase subunit
MFTKILIANRGEIAIRVIRACKELGVATVAVYSEADRAALHVRAADEAYCIGPAPSQDSYLNEAKVLEVATRCGADAIHPGYGFLSERASFAEACARAGIAFIGPNPEAIRVMGNKTTSRVAVHAMGVPLVPGMRENLASEDQAVAWAKELGFPLMMKAASGGGGKGLRQISRMEDLPAAYRAAKAESLHAFGDDAVYLERYIEHPRHIEIQLLGDKHGHIIYFPERECSIQRRHQKVIEEAPSTLVDPDMRRQMGEAAVKAARAVDYDSAGTVEFIVSGKTREFFFLEMNTRLQVEHPITEMITGIDLCKEMIRSAAGYPLAFRQEDVPLHGHALECRIYAEDPDNKFLPTPGKILGLRVPGGPGRAHPLRPHAVQAGGVGQHPGALHHPHEPGPVRILGEGHQDHHLLPRPGHEEREIHQGRHRHQLHRHPVPAPGRRPDQAPRGHRPGGRRHQGLPAGQGQDPADHGRRMRVRGPLALEVQRQSAAAVWPLTGGIQWPTSPPTKARPSGSRSWRPLRGCSG